MPTNKLLSKFPLIEKACSYIFNAVGSREELTKISMFDKYPLVHKAYQEQQGIAGFLGGSLPEAYGDFVLENAKLAEQYVKGGHDDKEAVIVGCILTNASPFTFDDIRRYESDYSPQVKALVDFLVKNEHELIDSEPTISQTIAITVLSHLTQACDDVANGVNEEAYDLSLSKEEMLPAEEYVQLHRHNPKLYAALDSKVDELLKLVKNKDAATGSKPSEPNI